ncbi:uncharacterized protein LOC117287990 [Asterias rubens]|uniref:uncharacterized protein LOC117287990 n=1 Tax=Asterias rubens TaxID=7604 RepID=UPI0014556E76|nr:uncharacterized protein LOC117287990 [Asterias rubens]
MKKGGKKEGPVGENSPASDDCECGPRDRFRCTSEEVFMCVPKGNEKDGFLESFRDGDQASYTLCNSYVAFEVECTETQPENSKTCSCYDEGDATCMAFSGSAFSCTYKDKQMTYTISNSICESEDNSSTTVNIPDTTETTTAVSKMFRVKPTLQKTTGYVTTLKLTDPITAMGKATSPTQPDSAVTSSTGGSPPSTRLVTNTVKIDIPTPSYGRGNIPVAIGVSLTLNVLLVALVIFVCWKKGGKRFCTKSRRKFNRSQTSTLNPDSSASAGRVNPTYDLDGRLAGGDVLHLTSLANVQKEEEGYAEIPPREYAPYMPDHPTTSYTALQKVRSTGSDDNDDPPVYTPIPVSNKPAKTSSTDDDYVEPDTVTLHPGEGANGASALNSSVLGKRQGRHQDARSPNPKSGGYVDVDSPPVVFSETPSAPRTSFADSQDQDPEDAYYFKLRGLSADTAPGELDQERLDHPTADSGQYQSLGASSATLSADTKLVDDGDAYNLLGRNAINLAKTAANATTNSNYDHMVIQAAAHNDGGNNAYDTVERHRLQTALKIGDAQQGATGGIINSNTDLKRQTAGYDTFERPGIKHAINTTGEGDYSLAMPLV